MSFPVNTSCGLQFPYLERILVFIQAKIPVGIPANRIVLPEESSERDSQSVVSRIKLRVELAKIKALLSCKSCPILGCKEH